MNEKLNPFHIAVLIHVSQMGVTVFSLPRLCAMYFGTNGWIGLIATGLVATANLALMQAVVRISGGLSVPAMLARFLPRPLRAGLLLGLAAMYGMLACLTSKQYVLMFEQQSFPATNPLVFRAGIDVLVFVLVMIGIYNLGKAATLIFFGTVMLPMLYFTLLNELRWDRYTLFFLQGEKNVLFGSLELYTAFLGFELCLFLIPHVKQGTGWFRGVYAGHGFTFLLYVVLTVLTFGFFSFGQLKRSLYPMLDMAGHIGLPIIERVDTLLFTFFFLIAVMTVAVYFWIATELAGSVFPNVRKGAVAGVLIVATYFISSAPNELVVVSHWLRRVAFAATGTAFLLPLVLIAGMLATRRRRPAG